MLQNRSITDQQVEPKIVKTNPGALRFRKLRIVMFIGLALLLIAIVLLLVARLYVGSSSLSPFLIWYPGFLALMVVYNLMIYIPLGRYWKSLEIRRQAAAQGDQSLLADEQPTPDAHALSLPITVQQRPKWRSFLVFGGIMLLTMLLVLVVFLVFGPQWFHIPGGRPLPSSFIPIMVGAFLIVALLFSGLFFGLFYYKVRKQITLTEGGLLLVGIGPKVHSIPWQEAKLFAINRVYGSLGYKQPVLFELSSAHEIIRWGWMRNNSARVLFFAQPRISPADYNKQMQGVLSIIAARTGLPLYDLRKKSAWEQK